MFTGIITALGTIEAVTPLGAGQDMRLTIAAPAEFLAAHGGTALGASIACSGCCLTATSLEPARFTVDVSAETLACTTLANWAPGVRINLERSLRLGDELGGHLVSGHVDGVGLLSAITPENGSLRLDIIAPAPLHRFIAEKGSVAVDGVSLTVNSVNSQNFSLNIIPHTATHTTLGDRAIGDAVNLEIDTIARYVARWRETEA